MACSAFTVGGLRVPLPHLSSLVNMALRSSSNNGLDVTGFISSGGDYSKIIIKIFDTIPLTELDLILLAVTMVAFYLTTPHLSH